MSARGSRGDLRLDASANSAELSREIRGVVGEPMKHEVSRLHRLQRLYL